MISTVKDKLVRFAKDTDGSEAVEMISTTTMIVIFLLVAFMFFTYVFEMQLCATATQRVVRQSEVAGAIYLDDMNAKFSAYLGSDDVLYNKNLEIVRATYIPGTNHIQLKNTFAVRGSCVYRLHLVNPGSYSGFYIDLPISTEQRGMSEVYWTQESGGTEMSRY